MPDVGTPLPCRRPELVSRPFGEDGSYLVRNRHKGESFQLGPEEHFLLAQLDGTRTAENICAAFAERFSEPLTERQLQQFLELADGLGLLQEQNQDGKATARDSATSLPVPAWETARPDRGLERTALPGLRRRLAARLRGLGTVILHGIARLLNAAVDKVYWIQLRYFEFVPRPDDIFIVTYPRSGTTWMQMILYQLTTDGRMDFPHIAEYCPWFEQSLRSGQGFETRPSPRIFKSHLPYSRIPKGPCKYIYVTRDGKDVVVSNYHLHRMYFQYDGTFAEFFELFMRGKIGYGPWFHHVAGWWAHRNDPNVLLLTYEELTRDLEACLRRIAAFCGFEVSPERFPVILERCRFAFMKAHERQFDPAMEWLWERGVQLNSFLRAGRIGDGADYLDSEQTARFDQAYQRYLAGTGFAANGSVGGAALEAVARNGTVPVAPKERDVLSTAVPRTPGPPARRAELASTSDGDKEPRMSLVPTPTTALALDEINPASFDFWLRNDVEGALAKLRHERPVAWHQHPDSGKGFWSITRFDDIAAATRDWGTFSSAYGIQVMVDPEDMPYTGAIQSMISMDPPKHTKLRGVVNRGFTPKMIAKAEGAVRERARRIVDTIAPKGEAEFVTEVADALPLAIICDMMGVPEDDRAKLLDLTNRLLAGGDTDFGGTRESLVQAASELREYGLWLGRKRLEHPQSDLTTTLVHAEVDGEAMPPEDLGPFFLLLIATGNETTRTAISQGMWAFTQFPQEKRKWQANLDGLSATAVEEIIRWASPVMHMRRTVTRDTTFAGVQMRRDQKIAMWYISANRDEKYFPDPYRFDITRAPNEQCAFGTGGAHFCLGSHLARREVTAIFVELFRRLPDIEATAEPEKLRSNFIRGIKRLPVAFRPA